ncbi:hypothetical protein FIV42_28900 [Persicimonas caeni]|uniref:Uncharacterized protein n=1 Tax=Persicimonas caeni TaxID=2292766 RepID=A0A4Y6Q2B9_PERCE|nr:hypothetical protein [Persicimonas caeni]QDG54619.1 hypothetical protein FIV42_28900 [Persicimonas caeni]QED35840.1 hypothetical protein FRD00_28895 [Persicimonas caeni]
MSTRYLLTLLVSATLVCACSTKKENQTDEQTEAAEESSTTEESTTAADEAGEPTAENQEAAEAETSEEDAEYLRVLIRSDDAPKLAKLVNAELAAEAGGVIKGENMGCVVSKDSKTTCGQILDAEGKGYDLEHLGYDEAGGASEQEIVVTETTVSEEESDGKKMLRVRFTGEPAERVAGFLNAELAQQPGAVIDGANHSCVVSSEGETTCGFILAADGSAADLEAFGYQ